MEKENENENNWVDDAIREAFEEVEKHKAQTHPEDPFAGKYYNKTALYKEQVEPLLRDASRICKENGIPHLWWAIHSLDSVNSEQARSGNAVIMVADHPVAREMALLGNVADSTISLKQLAKFILMGEFLGIDFNSKSSD